MTKIDFSYYNFNKYQPPPERKLNGGLYTGEEFKEERMVKYYMEMFQ